MSRIEPKAGEWLRQQIEELGALRNASVRDPQFKAWRQNTLTFIQRIWPGDTSKSERFRRIPFSPASTRVDARQVREQFERGCGEALEYINSLLNALGEERVAPGTTRAVPLATEPMEGDFPVVDLGAEASAEAADASREPAPPMLPEGLMGESAELDLPGSADAASAPRSTGPSRLPASAIRSVAPEGLPEDFNGATPLDGPQAVPGTPARPADESRISVRGTPPTAPKEARPNPLKDILDRHREPEAGPARASKSGRARKGGKSRLKDMLGLSSLETAGSASAPPSVPPSAPAEMPAEGTAPMPPSRTSEPVAKLAPPATRPMESWTMPEFMTPEESVLPLTAEDVEPSHPAAMDSMPVEVWHDAPEPSESWHDVPSAFASASVETSSAGPAEPADADAGEHAEAEPSDDAQDRARVTEEFFKNSLVLSSKPRAVKRRDQSHAGSKAQPLPERESSASRILAIAAEVDALGVPEGHRARARAALLDLARQLDEPEVSWDALRDGVQFVMEFPAVARRALPLLLPFLDLAA